MYTHLSTFTCKLIFVKKFSVTSKPILAAQPRLAEVVIPNGLVCLDVSFRPTTILYPQLSDLLNVHGKIASK